MIANRVKELRMVRAGDLKGDARNWRRHPKAQRDALSAVLADVGYADALLARETPNGLVLVDGHLRAGMDAEQVVPVLVVDLDEREAGVVLATLDPLASMAQRDTDALKALLVDVGAEMESAVGAMHPAQTLPPLEEQAVKAPPKAVTQRGDVWALGRHRVMCGDSTDDADVGRLLEGGKVDCIIADPPYSSGGRQDSGRTLGSKGTTGEYQPIAGDIISTRGYLALMKRAIGAIPANGAYVFTDWKMWPTLCDAMETSSWRMRSMLVWAKDSPGTGTGWRAQHELIACALRGNWPMGHGKAAHGNILTAQRTKNGLHPTEKPVDLLETIMSVTAWAETFYDPFVGSGTAIIAAERQGRACYAMDMEPRYVDTAVKRWEAYTGQQAHRVSKEGA